MQQTITTSTPSIERERAIETDLHAHVADTFTTSAIRGGQLVPVSWEDLTTDERRTAYTVLFCIYDQEV